MTHAMQAKLERFKKVALGAPAPALTLPDTSGQEHKLHELRGTVTLLDFWASWCSPCLRQIPDLKEAYAKWHERGFEIIGISVDSKAERWKAAIRKYEMNWPQLSDVKGWASRAAAEYNVTFIPFNFLLDAEGRILAKNLHSGALDAKLAELLGGE
ncbi:MAG: TlpA family protein disulfide reductase [Bacteroidetes bacterium]|nr:MAG: TlpA family protein disulfide reductase [Bacteroidota bacterium]